MKLNQLSLIAGAALVATAATAQGQILSEGFDVVLDLAPPATTGVVVSGADGDWIGVLNSEPLGITGIFQGNGSVFPGQSGGPTSYAGLNFNNSGSPGTISTWMISPEVTLSNGNEFSFYTRTESNAFPDHLELRLSTNGASTDVGSTASSVGDFTTLLVDVNPGLNGQYPEEWAQFTATVSGLAADTTGRFAFRYAVPNAGPTGANSNYIGIDTVLYTAVPEPASLSLLGLSGLALIRRRR